ncbi:MAG TPA: alpha/beta hydrolase [Streptosporangiaceae bacterium]
MWPFTREITGSPPPWSPASAVCSRTRRIPNRADSPAGPAWSPVNNTTDPGTPYPNALAMVRELHAARLLTVEGYGHTAFLNPSACAQAYESAYLIDGALPPAGTTCRQDHRPFT